MGQIQNYKWNGKVFLIEWKWKKKSNWREIRKALIDAVKTLARLTIH